MYIQREMKSTQFEKHYDKGHSKLLDLCYDEALDSFYKAKKNFKVGEDSFYRLVDLTLDESRVYKGRKEFTRAFEKIRACEEEAKKHYKNRKPYQIEELEWKECEVKFLSQNAQIMISEIENSRERDSKFIDNINQCISNYSKAIDIVASVLSDQNWRRKLAKGQIQDWEQKYAETIISSIDPIIVEAEKSDENLLLFHLIYQIGEKMERFFKLSCKNKSITRQYSRSMYYRGAMLLKTSVRYTEIETFLIKDYNFCRTHNYQSDEEKTRVELVKYYTRIQNFDEARNFLKTNELKRLYNKQILGDRSQVKKLEQQIKCEDFLSNNPEQQLSKLRQVFKLISDDQNQWWGRFISIARSILPYIRSREVNFFICTKAAQSYFENFDELNALHFCTQSLKYCRSSQEKYEILFLMMQIYSNSNRSQKLSEIEKELKLIVPQENKQYLLSYIKNREFYQKRNQILTQKLLCSEKQKNMFQILEKLKQEYRAQKMSLQKQQNQNFVNSNSHPLPLSFMRSTQEYKNSEENNLKQILQETYQNLCKKANVEVRLPILHQIKNIKGERMFIQADLSQFFQLSNPQLQIYLEFMRNEEWDLRNFLLKKSFIQKFLDKIPFNQVKSFKICIVNKQISEELFQKLLVSLQYVCQLHLEKLDRKFKAALSKVVFRDFSRSFQNLRVLKLKNCQVVDDDLQNLSQFHQHLTQLDLAANQITGSKLAALNKMKFLRKLNLSYNPLQVFSQLANQNLIKLKLKCLKRFNLSQKIGLPQLKFLQVLDISENRSEVLEHVMRSCSEYLLEEQLLELPNFREMRVKKSNITQIFLATLNEFISFCLGFKNLDLRFCHYSKTKLQNFEKYLAHCGKVLSIDARAYLGEPYDDKF